MLQTDVIKNHVQNRLAALSKFQREMEQIQFNESKMKGELKNAVKRLENPIRMFVLTGNFLDTFCQSGLWEGAIALHLNGYGFGENEDIERQFGTLKKAWNNAIEIKLCFEQHNVKVIIAVNNEFEHS